jgi:hypothetical protein
MSLLRGLLVNELLLGAQFPVPPGKEKTNHCNNSNTAKAGSVFGLQTGPIKVNCQLQGCIRFHCRPQRVLYAVGQTVSHSLQSASLPSPPACAPRIGSVQAYGCSWSTSETWGSQLHLRLTGGGEPRHLGLCLPVSVP